MSDKFFDFMTSQSKYGKSAYFLDDVIYNNSNIKSKTGEVFSVAEKIQEDFKISCRMIVEVNDKSGLSDYRKKDERENVNVKLLHKVANIINESMYIERNSKIDQYIIAKNMIEKVFNPMVETANEINSILNKNSAIL